MSRSRTTGLRSIALYYMGCGYRRFASTERGPGQLAVAAALERVNSIDRFPGGL